jgi:hypothetical protein
MKTIRILLPFGVLAILGLHCASPMTGRSQTKEPRIWENEPYANTNGGGS